MAMFAERTELALQQLKFGASNKDWGASLEVRRHGQEDRTTLPCCVPLAGPAPSRSAGLLVRLGASSARAVTREAFGQQVR